MVTGHGCTFLMPISFSFNDVPSLLVYFISRDITFCFLYDICQDFAVLFEVFLYGNVITISGA